MKDQNYKSFHSTNVSLDAIPDDETTEVGVDVPPVVQAATPPGAGWWPTVELLFDESRLVEELGTWAKTLLETQLLICVWQGTQSPLWAWPMYHPSQVPPLHEDPDLAGWNVVMPLNGLGQGVWEEPEADSTGGAASSSFSSLPPFPRSSSPPLRPSPNPVPAGCLRRAARHGERDLPPPS